jgi:hypothetical protein
MRLRENGGFSYGLNLVAYPSSESRKSEREPLAMAKLALAGEVKIRRYNGSPECDVIVSIGGREMMLRLPDFSRAVKWAELEARNYKLAATFSEELG